MLRKLLVVLLFCISLPALAQSIYSWKDASGRVHYSDTPPDDGSASTVRNNSAPPAARPARAAPSVAEQELALRKRLAETSEADDKARKDRARDDERQRSCNSAKAQLAGLESGQRMAHFKDDGEKEFLDDDQRSAEIERTRGVVATSCK
jgi:hypothetical protein